MTQHATPGNLSKLSKSLFKNFINSQIKYDQ